MISCLKLLKQITRVAILPQLVSSSHHWTHPVNIAALSTDSTTPRILSTSTTILSSLTTSDKIFPDPSASLPHTGRARPPTASTMSSSTNTWGMKNLNMFWIGSAILCIWFLFIHSPPFIVERKVLTDPPFASHLAGAYTIYLSCLVNTLFTPSTRPGSIFHVWLGRVGMVAGVLSFIMGFYCAWLRPVVPPLGFAIGITIGGVAQLVSQFAGYRAIRQYQKFSKQLDELKEAGSISTPEKKEQRAELEKKKEKSLRVHIFNMVALFTVACGSPALIRITGMILPDELSVLGVVGSVVFLNLLAQPFGRSYLRKPSTTNRAPNSEFKRE
jgi:hypothetical protein